MLNHFLSSQLVTLLTGIMFGAFIALATSLGLSIELWSTAGNFLTSVSVLALLIMVNKYARTWQWRDRHHTYKAITAELIKTLLEESARVLSEAEKPSEIYNHSAHNPIPEEIRTRIISSLQTITNTVETLNNLGVDLNGGNEATNISLRCKTIEGMLFDTAECVSRKKSIIQESHRLKSLIHLRVKQAFKQ